MNRFDTDWWVPLLVMCPVSCLSCNPPIARKPFESLLMTSGTLYFRFILYAYKSVSSLNCQCCTLEVLMI